MSGSMEVPMRRVRCLLCFGIIGLLFALSAWGQRADSKLVRVSGAGVGYGGFLRISLWLADNLMKQDDRLSVWFDYYYTGKAFRDGLLLLADRKAEVCLVNSQGVAAMALRGRGLFPRPVPLRAVAALPQHDWCLFAVDAALGVRSFADLREKKVPLKLTTGFLDEAVGFLALEVLKRHGIAPEEFRRWGGRFVEGTPRTSRDDLASGKANAVFQEGAYSEESRSLARQRPLAYLSIDRKVAQELREELGWPSLTVPAHHYPGQDQPLLALDFSDWLICVRDDADENLAYQLARIVVEKGEELQRADAGGSSGVPSPSLNYPLDPQKLPKTSVPIHPGALRYYKEKGLF